MALLWQKYGVLKMKGWKTIVFNVLAAAVTLIPEARDAVIATLGGGTNAVLTYTVINLVLRVITSSPVAFMWISKEEQNGVEVRKEK